MEEGIIFECQICGSGMSVGNNAYCDINDNISLINIECNCNCFMMSTGDAIKLRDFLSYLIDEER